MIFMYIVNSCSVGVGGQILNMQKRVSNLSILCLLSIAWITRKGGELIRFIVCCFQVDFIGSVKCHSECVRALITVSSQKM